MILGHFHEYEACDPAKLVANPDISIGMITYNHEKSLAQAIESGLQQHVRTDFELIIYEDLLHRRNARDRARLSAPLSRGLSRPLL
jgi:hypothetical protein